MKRDYTKEHTDSGMLTLKPISKIAALQVYNFQTKTWINVELGNSNSNLMVAFVGEELAYLSKNQYQASIHRVATDSSNISEDNTHFTSISTAGRSQKNASACIWII